MVMVEQEHETLAVPMSNDFLDLEITVSDLAKVYASLETGFLIPT